MVSWECPTNPREASEFDPEAVHPDTKGVKFTSQNVVLGTPGYPASYPRQTGRRRRRVMGGLDAPNRNVPLQAGCRLG